MILDGKAIIQISQCNNWQVITSKRCVIRMIIMPKPKMEIEQK